MRKPSILLIGAGGRAQACIDVIEQEGRFSIAGLVGMREEVDGKLDGYPILGVDGDLPGLYKKIGHALITIGQIKTPSVRVRIFELVETIGYRIPAIVSPHAYVSPRALVGDGSIVMHGAVVNSGAVIGRNCILNTQSIIEHGVIVEDHCHISTKTVINGGSTIGEGTFLGSGSVIRETICIGRNSLIGMGQMIQEDCPDETRLTSSRSDLCRH